MTDETAGVAPETSRFARPYDQVLSLCEEFATAWESATRPAIAPYLGRVGDGLEESLLRNLLQIEIGLRRRDGEYPRAEEYLARFTRHSPVIRQVFLESLSSLGGPLLAAGPGADTPEVLDSYATRMPEEVTDRDEDTSLLREFDGQGDDSTSLDGPREIRTTSLPKPRGGHAGRAPVASRLGDYRLLRELGRGGMGVVYQAVHVSRGDQVALKVLPHVDGSRLYRFKREFRSASGISHPNLIGLHNLEADGDQWFFTMEYIQGVDFLEHVRPDGQLDEGRLRSALAQLVMGVMALHSHHIIHRDLKPSNVMVTRDGRVLVLDFGLVVEMERANVARSAEQLAGTPAYMAPEQVAGRSLTPSCDWYAVGTMLYEALSGRLPFQGTVGEILRDKMDLETPRLPRDPPIPEDLAALCEQLADREPGRRPDAFEIAKRISTGLHQAPSPAASPGLDGRRARRPGLRSWGRSRTPIGRSEFGPSPRSSSSRVGRARASRRWPSTSWPRWRRSPGRWSWPAAATTGNRSPSRRWTRWSTRWPPIYWPCPRPRRPC